MMRRVGGAMKKAIILLIILTAGSLVAAAPGPDQASGRPQTALPSYSIDAIRYATVKDFPLNGLVMGAPAGQKTDIAMVVWLTCGGGHTILFDSGFHRQKWIDQYHPVDFLFHPIKRCKKRA